MVVAAVVVAVIAAAPVVVMVPVAFVHLPALLVVVVVRMIPVGAGVGRLVPAARDPYVAATLVAPVAVLPCIAFAWRWRPALIAQRRRRSPDEYMNLPDSGQSKGRR